LSWKNLYFFVIICRNFITASANFVTGWDAYG